MISLAPSAQAGCGANPYLSTICWTAIAQFCPKGYAEANGQILPINNNQALFSLLGTTYGGDGKTTFALPNLRGRTIVGTGQGPGLSNITLGQQIGQEQYQLTIANMPAHTHSLNIGEIPVEGTLLGVNDTGDTISPQNAFPASRPTSGGTPKTRKPYYAPSSGNVNMAEDSVELSLSFTPSILDTSSVFSGRPFTILEPQIAIRACIAIQGTFPNRS